jgi:hypothetical protein
MKGMEKRTTKQMAIVKVDGGERKKERKRMLEKYGAHEKMKKIWRTQTKG